MMAGNEEQMRMWGGWKGFPLPAHWTAMTTFSPEAPSSLHPAPLFALSSFLPPSVFTSLSWLTAAFHITTGASALASAAQKRRRALLSSLVLSFLFLPLIIFTSKGRLFGAFLASSPPPPPLPSSSPCRPVLCFSHHVTSVHDPELCNGAAHAGRT